jgi:hypothetical protein
VSLDCETDRREIQISLSMLRRQAGDRIVANLFRGLAGCDRLSSLVHLLQLNSELPLGSVAQDRNRQTLMAHIFGTIRELAKVLDGLNGAGIEAALTDVTPWLRLNDVRRRWTQQAAIRWRDQVAFHLCYSTADAVRGLESIQQRSDEFILAQTDKPALLASRCPVAEEMLLAASGLKEADLMAVVKDAPEDSAQMTLDLQAIARDLLRQCGARI